MNRSPLETGKVYHVYNRGTDKRDTFMDDSDRFRFMTCMYEFNDERPALNWRQKLTTPEVQPRERFVEILAYCLMRNHYHFMLRQIKENGISNFMRKIGTGYSMYFNQRYKRSGSLFQGRFKSIIVDKDEYLRYLPHYIHMNPKEAGIPNWQTYRWSSCSAFISGVETLPLIDDLAFMRQLYEPQGYQASLDEWITDQQKMDRIGGIMLD